MRAVDSSTDLAKDRVAQQRDEVLVGFEALDLPIRGCAPIERGDGAGKVFVDPSGVELHLHVRVHDPSEREVVGPLAEHRSLPIR